MANACMNHLKLQGPTHLIKNLLSKLDRRSDDFLEAIHPTPEGLNYKEEKDWRENNWGCRREIDINISFLLDNLVIMEDLDFSSVIIGYFVSDWVPPIAFYNYLESYGISVKALYIEEGVGFCGEYINGVNNEINYCEFFEIPKTIINAFGLEEADF